MRQTVLALFHCPICSAELMLDEEGKNCRCQGKRQHCFDFSKSGYLNLANAHAGDGDQKAAVQARRAFLDAGYYRELSDEINRILDSIPSRTVLDAGCGEGYYTNRMARDDRLVIGTDLSRCGIDYAARRAKAQNLQAGYAVANLFDLPISDNALEVVTNIFAPCAEKEFLRVLKPGGYLLLVGAGSTHLMGLKKAIYEDPYQNTGRADLPSEMEQAGYWNYKNTVTVCGSDMIEALFSMTPYYWRTSQKDREKLKNLECLTTEVDFDIFLFRKEALV